MCPFWAGTHRVTLEAETGGGEVFHGFKMSDDKTCLGGYKTDYSVKAVTCATKCRVDVRCLAFSSEFGGRQACVLHMSTDSCGTAKQKWMQGVKQTVHPTAPAAARASCR